MGTPWENAASNPQKPWERALDQANLATGITQTPEQQARQNAASISGYLMQKAGVPSMDVPSRGAGYNPEELKQYGFTPEGGRSANNPSPVSARSALGVLGDYIAAEGAGSALKSLGGTLQKLPYRRADRLAAQVGAAPLSEVMAEYGAAPITKEGIYEQAQRILGKVSSARAKTVEDVAKTGATGSMDSALQDARNFLGGVQNSGSAVERKFSPKFEQMITDQAAINPEGGPGINQILEAKTGMGSTIPKSAFGESAVTPLENRFRKAFAGGFKKESEALANRALPGNQLSKQNSQIQTLLSTIPDVERKAILESGRLPVTQIDAALLGADPSLYIAKNLGRLAHLPGAQIYGGKALSGIGNVLPYAVPGYEGLNTLNRAERPQSPWNKMSQ